MAKHNYSELAKQAGVSRPTIYKWLNDGILDSELAKHGVKVAPDLLEEMAHEKELEDSIEKTAKSLPETMTEGEVVEIGEFVNGKEAFKCRYICAKDANGGLFWKGMEATESEKAWMEKNSKASLDRIRSKNPDAFKADGIIKKLETGIPGIDSILGGGLAKGRIIEIYGENSTGKTTMALQITAHFQSLGKKVAYMDAEQAIDKKYAEALGVDFSTLMLAQSNGMEETIEAVRDICRDRTAELVIVDSIAALLPTSEHEGMAGDANMAVKAKLMAQWCRMIPGNMAKNGVTVIFINQIRNFSQGWGSSEYTPGGNSMKFAAFQRLCLRLVSEKDKTDSRDVKITCIKNKLFSPYEETVLHLEYGKGFTGMAKV